MKRKFLLIILFICGFMQQDFAQQITVSGNVTSSDDGAALSGVSVKVKGNIIALQINN